MADRRGYDCCPVGQLETELETSEETGLSAGKAQEKLLRDGPNELEKQKAPGLFMLFVTQLINVSTGV